MKHDALTREICMLTNRIHGAGLVAIDHRHGRVFLSGDEVARVPARASTGKPKLCSLVIRGNAVSPSQRILHTLIQVLEDQASVQGIDIEGVRFKCTSDR